MSFTEKETNADNANFFTTDTNLMVNLLANNDKIKNDTWEFKKKSSKEKYDDDITNYLNMASPKKKAGNDGEDMRSDKDKDKYTEKEEGGDNKYGSDTDNNNKIGGSKIGGALRKDDPDLRLRKMKAMHELLTLSKRGVQLSQNYSMNSDLEAMEFEYEFHKQIKLKENGIKWYQKASLFFLKGIEEVNNKANPFDFSLEGWSDELVMDSDDYYDVYADLYEKYKDPTKGYAPELRLAVLLGMSAMNYGLSNKKEQKEKAINETLNTDTKLTEGLRRKAIHATSQNKNAFINERTQKEHNEVLNKMRDLEEIKKEEMKHLEKQKREELEYELMQQKMKNDLLTKQYLNNIQMNKQNNINNNISSQQNALQQEIDREKLFQATLMKQNNNNDSINNIRQQGVNSNLFQPKKNELKITPSVKNMMNLMNNNKQKESPKEDKSESTEYTDESEEPIQPIQPTQPIQTKPKPLQPKPTQPNPTQPKSNSNLKATNTKSTQPKLREKVINFNIESDESTNESKSKIKIGDIEQILTVSDSEIFPKKKPEIIQLETIEGKDIITLENNKKSKSDDNSGKSSKSGKSGKSGKSDTNSNISSGRKKKNMNLKSISINL